MRRALGAALTVFLLVVVALLGSGLVPIATPGPIARPGHLSPEATGNFDQFVVVLMENHDLADIYGPAVYMTQLADAFGFSTGWTSITNPSQPNYIALIGGSTFGVSGDGNHPNLNHPTIVDLLEHQQDVEGVRGGRERDRLRPEPSARRGPLPVPLLHDNHGELLAMCEPAARLWRRSDLGLQRGHELHLAHAE